MMHEDVAAYIKAKARMHQLSIKLWFIRVHEDEPPVAEDTAAVAGFGKVVSCGFDENGRAYEIWACPISQYPTNKVAEEALPRCSSAT